jgi:hypothetical protein
VSSNKQQILSYGEILTGLQPRSWKNRKEVIAGQGIQRIHETDGGSRETVAVGGRKEKKERPGSPALGLACCLRQATVKMIPRKIRTVRKSPPITHTVIVTTTTTVIK